jgi:hypothetical protein
MFTVELYAKVRHAVMIEGLSRREAAKRFGIHRNTITKMLSFSVPPGYRRRERPASKKLGPFMAWIDAILEGDRNRLGKQDNCQVAVTLSIANHAASLPIAYRLYLPEARANDQIRRNKAHIPKEIEFKTKPQIALDQIRAAHAAGVAPGVVLADARPATARPKGE